jgi:ribonuclease VapC
VIVDSSAIVAMIRRKAEAEQFVAALERSRMSRISAANYLESGIVVDSARDPAASRQLDELLRDYDVGIAQVSAAHARLAGRRIATTARDPEHPAQLNFGDCVAYALAEESGEPLLYKRSSSGEDFTHTGARSALDR